MNAALQIQAALRKEHTYLKHCYTTPPFKIADITEDRSSGCLHLMMMCSSPGVLDGDVYTMELQVDEGCSLQLHTQSYQRLFHMKTGASQQVKISVAKNASFVYLPHPAVPHEHSIFKAHNKIYLTGTSELTWGEILTCGRQLKEERFTFTSYHNVTEIYIDNKLTIKENLLIQPALVDPMCMGLLEGYTHQASLICIRAVALPTTVLDRVHEYLTLQKDIEFGVTRAPGKGILVRILGYKAEQLYQCLQVLAGMIRSNAIAKS